MSAKSSKISIKSRPVFLALIIVPPLAMIALCCAAIVWYYSREVPVPPIEVRCPPLPETFKESDLIGTWIASYNIFTTDMLIIREDGTYKQVFEDNVPETDYHYRYDSDWQEWWIEYRESGYLRLHLKGMQRFDNVSGLPREGGGTSRRAIDTCEFVEVPMTDEVVLIVTGVSNRAKSTTPRGIELRQTRLAGSDWAWSFRLQDVK